MDFAYGQEQQMARENNEVCQEFVSKCDNFYRLPSNHSHERSNLTCTQVFRKTGEPIVPEIWTCDGVRKLRPMSRDR